MTFQEKLVKLRKLRSITQDELASAVGVSRQAVYKWESGQSYPEAMKLVELKKLFGISIDDLLDDGYEVVLPEKKKKRIPKAERERIEREVRRAEEAEEVVDTPVEATVIETPIEEMLTVDETATPVVDETVVETPVEATVVEETAVPVVDEEPIEQTTLLPVTEESTVVETPKVEEDEKDEPKKKGFFARIFGW